MDDNPYKVYWNGGGNELADSELLVCLCTSFAWFCLCSMLAAFYYMFLGMDTVGFRGMGQYGHLTYRPAGWLCFAPLFCSVVSTNCIILIKYTFKECLDKIRVIKWFYIILMSYMLITWIIAWVNIDVPLSAWRFETE